MSDLIDGTLPPQFPLPPTRITHRVLRAPRHRAETAVTRSPIKYKVYFLKVLVVEPSRSETISTFIPHKAGLNHVSVIVFIMRANRPAVASPSPSPRGRPLLGFPEIECYTHTESIFFCKWTRWTGRRWGRYGFRNWEIDGGPWGAESSETGSGGGTCSLTFLNLQMDRSQN